MTLGERIKRLRAERPQGEQSREAFSAALEVSKNTIVNYENNSRVPDAIFLNKIIELDPSINPSWLLTGEGEMRRVVKLNESEQHMALRERLKNKRVRNGVQFFEQSCVFHGVSKEIIEKYIYGDYLPTKEELESIRKVAGQNWNIETGMPATRNEEAEKEIEKFISSYDSSLASNKIDIELLKFIVTEVEIAFSKNAISIAPEKKAELFSLVYEDVVGVGDKEDVAREKIKRLVKLVG